jgi:AcrR family transcriptional regulator
MAAAVASLTDKSRTKQQKLVESGIELFARRGYDAASTRMIETAAGVKRNLISYHFDSKESFWKACVGELFQRMTRELADAQATARDIEPAERLRFFIRRYVRLAARNPEIHRIMLDEGKRNDWRLAWIVEHHSRGFYAQVEQLVASADRLGVSPGIDTPHFYYLLISGAVIFAMAPECMLLSGKDPQTEAMIDAHADALANLLIRDHNV